MLDEITDSVVLHILFYLSPLDISRLGQTCRKLRRICHDEILWKVKAQAYLGIPTNFNDPLVCSLWRSEFIRLMDEVPLIETEVLRNHTDQVLHISHSHDGTRFATTAKDAFVIVWKTTYPAQLEYSYNMEKFSWKYTQFSEFNESDTLLLVSGVHFGTNHNTSGEVAVFTLTDGFVIQCRVRNKPYDIFGAWYSDQYLLSGELSWIGELTTQSVIWLNKASQETESEHTAVINQLFKFYNSKASSIRSLLVANCVDTNFNNSPSTSDKNLSNLLSSSLNVDKKQERVPGNPPSQPLIYNDEADFNKFETVNEAGATNINYNIEFYNKMIAESRIKKLGEKESSFEEEDSNSGQSSISLSDEVEEDEDVKKLEGANKRSEVIDERDKWLIFTCGSKTYTPHQIGFKRIRPVLFESKLDPGPCLKDRISEYRRRRALALNGQHEGDEINYEDYEAVSYLFDSPEAKIELNGHCIGMTLSPDHKFLYVNKRSWPRGAIVSNPLEPPPLAQEIDIVVIDMTSLRQIGMMRQCHKAFTSNDECFFIFLDASEIYLASGSEDQFAYIWDRQYGVSICKLPHLDIVNSVGFNPKNSQILVSVSDDNTIKIWRSKKLCRELGISYDNLPIGTPLHSNITT